MARFLHIFSGVFVFFASYLILVIWVAPLLSRAVGGGSLDGAARARFPVVIAVPSGAVAAEPKFFVVQMRHAPQVMEKAERYSYLLPAGTREIVDQDGDPARSTAQEIAPGRQRIALAARVGDAFHEVEYEAVEMQAFPLKSSFTDPKLGLWLMPLSFLFAWIALRLTDPRRRKAPSPGPDAAGAGGG